MVRAPRSLVRWGEYEERALILSLQLACNETGVTLPWHRVVHHMGNLNVPATEGAIVQHLSKMRQRMEQAGQAVPPPLRRGGGNSIAAPSKSTMKRPMPHSSVTSTNHDSTKSTSNPRTSLRVHKKTKKSNPKAKKNGLSSPDFDDDSSATVENEDPEADYVPDKKSTNPARTIQTTSKSVQQIKKESSVDEQSDNEEVAPIKRRRRYGAGSKLLNMEDSDPGSPPDYEKNSQPEQSDKTNAGDLIPFPTYEADVNDNFLTNEDIAATMHDVLPDAGESLLAPDFAQYGNALHPYNPFNYGDIQAPVTDLGYNNSYNGIGQMIQIPTYNQHFGDHFGAFNPFASNGGIPLNGDDFDNMGAARGISSSTEQSVGHPGGHHPNYFNPYGVGADTVLGGGTASMFDDAYQASTMGGYDA